MSKTQTEKRVTYVETRSGSMFRIKNPHGVRLTIGGTVLRDPVMVFSEDAFRMLRKQNPDVVFLERLR